MFGGNVFGWTADAPTSFGLLDRFVDAGFNAIDTADVYSRWIPGHVGGESETVIGNWLAKGEGRRERIMLATKVAMEMGPGEKGLSRDHIVRAVEASLRRLQTDRIDLYQSHQPDEDVPIEETLCAYEELIASGKVLAIGASNYSPAQLGEALDASEAQGCRARQTCSPGKLSMIVRNENGPEGLPGSAGSSHFLFGLASGFLERKYRSEADLAGRPRAYRVKNYLNARGYRILEALTVGAEISDAGLRVALSLLMARPSITAPIASDQH